MADARAKRPWIFHEWTQALCAQCLRVVGAKVVVQDGRVLLRKRCPEHGLEVVLLADDAEYWLRARQGFQKPGELPRRFQTEVKHGCPYDCGLCPDHEQHSCLTLVEVGDACNLTCPVCYAASGAAHETYRPLEQIERMLDAVVASEGQPDVVQLSGGEPCEHPEFFRILDAARARPIRHLMVNTNGLRLAREADFARRLAAYGPGFEVYLQFDSLRPEPLVALRGVDLSEVRRRALERLDEAGLSTTLVVTLKRGLNDDECGAIVEHALRHPCVRGVTFQPIQDAGRNEGFDPAQHRLTLTEVRRRILEQTTLFAPEDLVPVPCHPDGIAMAYALKVDGEVFPLTRHVSPELLEDAGSTIRFESIPGLRQKLFEAFSTHHSPSSGAEAVAQLLCCLPDFELPPGFGYSNLFRVIVMQFLDAHSLDLRSVRKTCVHIVHPDDERIIPFDTYNLLYRGDLERTRLAALRAEVGA